MSYQSPTINPSGTTFAQFEAGGFHGQLTRVVNANSFSATVRSLILGPLDVVERGIVHTIDAFLRGDPITTRDANASLMSYALTLKAITAALDEVNALVDANPGTLKTVMGSGASGRQTRRSFP
jgi:hypothetical protein